MTAGDPFGHTKIREALLQAVKIWQEEIDTRDGTDIVTPLDSLLWDVGRLCNLYTPKSVADELPVIPPGSGHWAVTAALAFWEKENPDGDGLVGWHQSWVDRRANWRGPDGVMDYHGDSRVTYWMPLPPDPIGETT